MRRHILFSVLAFASVVALTPSAVHADRGGGVITDPVTVSSMGRIDAGNDSTCAVRPAGWLQCWGADASGQLGNGTISVDVDNPFGGLAVVRQDGLAFVSVSVGGGHACGVADRYSAGAIIRVVVCWGSNSNGQALGTGAKYDEPTSYAAPPLGDEWSSVTTGLFHTCALTVQGDVYCWGFNGGGQLGLGNTANQNTPTKVTLPGAVKATAISAGQGHVCAVLVDGRLSCWGNGFQGQLGNGGLDDIGDDEPLAALNAIVTLPAGRTARAVATGNDHTCVVLDNGQVTCWGLELGGRLGNGRTASKVMTPPAPVNLPGGALAKGIAAGGSHSCALLVSGQLSCWGSNGDGKVGTGDSPDQLVPSAALSLPYGETARAVTTGDSHTCAILAGDDVVCWGSNVNGRSGYDTPVTMGHNNTPVEQGTVHLAYATTAFTTLTPRRVLDTRPTSRVGYSGSKPGPNSVVIVQIPTNLSPRGPSAIGAVVLNVTVTQTDGPGFVTAYPADAPRPVASNLNITGAGETTANLVTVQVSATGTVALFTEPGTHLIADLAGFFQQSPASKAGRFVQLTTPARMYDTRPASRVNYGGDKPTAGQTVIVKVSNQGGLAPSIYYDAVVLNVTATDATGPGYVSVWPEGTLPIVSNLNVQRAGQTIPNQVIVPVGADGSIRIFTESGTHLIVDVVGYFTSRQWDSLGSGLFVPTAPFRHLDTRATGIVVAGGTVVVKATNVGHVAPAGVSAVIANVTATQTTGPGYLTVFSAGLTSPPFVSNLNADFANQTVPNHVISGVSGLDGKLKVFSQSGAHVIVDISGYFI